ncbi:hypothetical protein [Lutibacter sp.]
MNTQLLYDLKLAEKNMKLLFQNISNNQVIVDSGVVIPDNTNVVLKNKSKTTWKSVAYEKLGITEPSPTELWEEMMIDKNKNEDNDNIN